MRFLQGERAATGPSASRQRCRPNSSALRVNEDTLGSRRVGSLFLDTTRPIGALLLESRHGAACRASSRRSAVFDLPARCTPGEMGRRAAPVHAENPARERPPQRHRRRGRGGRRLGRRCRAVPRDLVRARPRPAPGLHRRAVRRRPRRDARRDARPERGSGEDQSADTGRARDRPLGAGRRIRHAACDRTQRRARVRAQQGALRIPPLGTDRVRQLQGRAAEHRHRATRSTSNISRAWSSHATAWRSPTRSSAPTRTRR